MFLDYLLYILCSLTTLERGQAPLAHLYQQSHRGCDAFKNSIML